MRISLPELEFWYSDEAGGGAEVAQEGAYLASGKYGRPVVTYMPGFFSYLESKGVARPYRPVQMYVNAVGTLLRYFNGLPGNPEALSEAMDKLVTVSARSYTKQAWQYYAGYMLHSRKQTIPTIGGPVRNKIQRLKNDKCIELAMYLARLNFVGPRLLAGDWILLGKRPFMDFPITESYASTFDSYNPDNKYIIQLEEQYLLMFAASETQVAVYPWNNTTDGGIHMDALDKWTAFRENLAIKDEKNSYWANIVKGLTDAERAEIEQNLTPALQRLLKDAGLDPEVKYAEIYKSTAKLTDEAQLSRVMGQTEQFWEEVFKKVLTTYPTHDETWIKVDWEAWTDFDLSCNFQYSNENRVRLAVALHNKSTAVVELQSGTSTSSSGVYVEEDLDLANGISTFDTEEDVLVPD